MGLWYEAWIKRCSCADPPNQEDNPNKWKLTFCRKFFSEFLGMFAFVFIASGTVASATFYNFKDASSKNNTIYDSSDILYINLGISFGYTLGLYICIENVSYLNLALTLVFCVLGKMKPKDIIPCVVAQFMGALVAGSLIYWLYTSEINQYRDSPTTSLIFSSSVNGDHFGKAVMDQILKTIIFTIGVMAIIDERKNKQDDSHNTDHKEPLKTIKPSKRLEPLMIGLILFLVGIAFSYYARFYFNPLQDLSGLIIVAAAKLSKTKWWGFAQILPVGGAFFAAIIYIMFIENNHPKPGKTTTSDAELLSVADVSYGSVGN